jgi:hypothetical protein
MIFYSKEWEKDFMTDIPDVLKVTNSGYNLIMDMKKFGLWKCD